MLENKLLHGFEKASFDTQPLCFLFYLLNLFPTLVPMLGSVPVLDQVLVQQNPFSLDALYAKKRYFRVKFIHIEISRGVLSVMITFDGTVFGSLAQEHFTAV